MRRLLALGLAFTAVVAFAAPAAAGPVEVEPSDWPDRPDPAVEIFMFVGASDQEIADVRTAVERSNAIKRFAYFDQQDALEAFREIFKSDPELVESLNAASLPVSFRLELRKDASKKALERRFERLAGVEDFQVTRQPTAAETRAAKCKLFREERRRGFPALEAFMPAFADAQEVQTVEDAIAALPEVARYTHLDKDAQWAEFKRQFAGDEELLENVNADVMQESFRVWLRSGVDPRAVAAVLRDNPSVENVSVSAPLAPNLDSLCDER